MRYVLEYIGGTKGDMLTTLLINKDELKFDELRRAVNRGNKLFLMELSAQISYAFKNPSIEEFKKRLLISNDKILTAHGLYFLQKKEYRDVLKELDFKVKKLIFEKRHYQTINIEGVFKNLRVFSPVFEQAINFQRKEDSYRIDYYLTKKNIPINNTNRAEALYKTLKNDKFLDLKLFNNPKHCLHRDLLSYQDLYIDFNLSDPFLESLDIESYKNTVEQSWLPDEIHVFGETWKPKDYGYRSF